MSLSKDHQYSTYHSELGYYLAGLIEGDGTIIVPTKDKTEKGKSIHPIIRIVFTLPDLPLAEKLQQELSCGYIQKPNSRAGDSVASAREKGNYVLYEVQDLQGLFKLAKLINGKMRTPKIEALHRLIHWLNKKNLQNQWMIPLGLDYSPIESNSWFSGFSDADAYFQVSLMENKELDSIKRIKCYYKLEIQQNYHGELEAYLPILSKIAEFLQTNILTRKRFINNKEYSSYTVITSSNATNSLVDNYFKDYPMFSSKQLNYLEWSKVFNFILNKKHLLRKGALICLESKNNMNKNRKTWNWDHLDQFYKL